MERKPSNDISGFDPERTYDPNAPKEYYQLRKSLPPVPRRPSNKSGDSKTELLGGGGDDIDGLKQQQKQQQKRYCFGKLTRRGCIIMMVALVLLNLVVLVLTFFVIVPAVTQKIVDGAALQVSNVLISSPSSSSILVRMTGAITGASGMSAKIRPFQVGISYNGTQLGAMTLPEVNVVATGPTPIDITSAVNISSLALFNSFTLDLLKLSSVAWQLSGITDLQALGILDVKGVNFNKQVPLAAFSGFNSVTVQTFDLTGSTPTQVNVAMSVAIANPSVVNISPLGVLSLDIYYKGVFMGNVTTTSEVSMLAGTNVFNMAGVITPDRRFPDAANDLFVKYLTGQTVTVQAVGAKTGASSIALYSQSLSGFPMNTQLNGIATPVISDIQFSAMSMTVLDSATVMLSGTVQVLMFNPLGDNSPLTIRTVGMETDILFNDVVAGHLVVPSNPIASQTGNTIVMSFSAKVNTTAAFADFVAAFVQQPSVALTLRGNAIVNTSSAAGDLFLNGLPIANTVTLTALNGLPDGSLTVKAVDVTGGSGSQLSMSIQVSLNNPSIVTSSLGDMSLGMYYKGVYLGRSTLTNFVLAPGANTIVAKATYVSPTSAADAAVGTAFLSNYLQSVSTTVSLVGDAKTTANALIAPGFNGLTMRSALPALNQVLVADFVQIAPNGLTGILTGSLASSMPMVNPFSSTIFITSLDFTIVTTAGKTLTRLQVALTDAVGAAKGPIKIAGKSTVTSPNIGFKTNLLNSLDQLGKLLGAGDPLNINGTMGVAIGSDFSTAFKTQLAYTQTIHAKISLTPVSNAI